MKTALLLVADGSEEMEVAILIFIIGCHHCGCTAKSRDKSCDLFLRKRIGQMLQKCYFEG
jgi:hypothetical protein